MQDTATTNASEITVASVMSNLPTVVTKEVKKPGDLIKLDLRPDELAIVEQINQGVVFEDSNTILLFGAAPQKQLSVFLDDLLGSVKVGEAGVAGTITLELSEGYDLMAIEQFKARLSGQVPGLLARAFSGAKTLAGLIKNLADKRMQIVGKFEKIERIAEERKRMIMQFNTRLDELQQQSEVYQRVVALHILGGERALLRAVEEYGRRLSALQVSQKDDGESSRLQDFARRINAFETRLLRIKIAYVQSVAVTIPRIQGIRQAGEIEIQNIIESLLFDVPNLKALVLQVMAMTNIKQAQEEDARRREVSDKIQGAATEMFHETYLASVASQGRGLDDVRKLAETADALMKTLNDAKRIEAENAEKRAQASTALVEIKEKFEKAMKESSIPKALPSAA